MRAMLLRQAAPVDREPLVLEELPDPLPGPGQLRIQVEVCGVCHTDLHTVEGEIAGKASPVIPGHQIVGRVDLLGAGVDPSWQGRRVGVPWLAHTCGACEACTSERENLCPHAEFTGFDRHGGFAEYTVAEADYVVPIPDALEDSARVAPLLCAGIIGYRALRLSSVADGGRLGLYGFGAAAHLVIQLARRRDMEVYVFTRTWKHRELAKQLGAAWVGGPDDAPRVRVDGAISFTPRGESLRRALELVEPGGTVACAGIYIDPIPELDYQKHLYHEKILRSVTASTRADAAGLMAAAADGVLHTEIEVAPLEQANQVLQRLKRSQLNGAAAVLHVR